jgi:transcriptional regulator with XRE-family HTH domain
MELLLTRLREARGWSKAELARRAKLNASTVGAIENGRVVAYEAQLKKLARALGIPVSENGKLVRGADEARTSNDES